MVTAAPALACAACARVIGKRAGHNLTDDGRVLCTRCLLDRTQHPRLWPDCADAWHDPVDHARYVASTRAAIASTLGLWGRPAAESEP